MKDLTTASVRWMFLAGMSLALASAARAGVYDLSEPDRDFLSENYFTFHTKWNDVKNVSADKVEFEYPLRWRYRLQVDLAGKATTARLSLEQKLNLSAAYLRCRRFSEAISLLTPLAAQHRNNFFIHANLGTAYQLAGPDNLQRALISLEQALAVWPKDHHQLGESRWTELNRVYGWSEHPYYLYRKMETFHHKLLKLRSRERTAVIESVDALFDDGKSPPTPVKFVGEGGDFEPGTIAKAEKAKLDAIDPKPLDVVQQLLIWLPDDQRLYWLLGELYNARGDLKAAQYIFDKLADFKTGGLRSREFRTRLQKLMDTPLPDQSFPTPEVKTPEGTRPGVDWHTLGVGFIAGAAVALFMFWQIREWRRRGQRRSLASGGR